MNDNSKKDWFSMINSDCSRKKNYSTNHKDVINRLFLLDKPIRNCLVKSNLRSIKFGRTKDGEVDFY